MKKQIAVVLSICFMLGLSSCVLEEVTMLYSETAETEGLFVAVNKTANCAFVGEYSCAERPDNFEITIPDDYNGIPITQIGGYHGRGVPDPFSVHLDASYMNAPEGSEYHDTVFCGNIDEFDIDEAYEVEEVLFRLNIGKNIESVEYVSMDDYYPHINEDGSITFYHPVVYITCSEDNEQFYAKNGQLYHKATDEPVSDFAYAS